MPNKEDIEALEEIIARGQDVDTAAEGAQPFVIIQKDSKVGLLEDTLIRPSRKKGSPNFIKSESFCAYVNQQKTPNSRLYVTCPTNIVAVLNHHGQGGPGWADHRAQFTLTQTPEWTTWKNSNGKAMDQRTFAQFIDDNSEDIAGQSDASLLELIRTIKASQQLEITGEIDEKNDVAGSSFKLAARTKAGAKDDVELPGEFALSIAPYEGGEKIAVRARLRIEIRAPKFLLNYDLVKIQKIEREALEGIVKTVANAVEMEPWFGTP
jgi:uncharacterized protein YfdQ (DUF2303 family)